MIILDFLSAVWNFFATYILQKAPYMVGFLTLLGYTLMGKKWYDTLGGTLKAIIGMLILNAGSSGLTGTFRPILAGLRDHFNLTACVTAPYYGQNAVQEAMESIGKSFADTVLLLLIAFIINILLVRFNRITKCRALFTTGHIQAQQAATAIWLMIFALPQLAGDGTTVSMPMMIVMSILLGAYWAVGANMTIKPMQELSNGAGFAIAHQQMFGFRLGFFLADKLFGGKDKDGKPKKVKKVGELEIPGLKGTDKVPDTNSYRVFDVHLTCMAFLFHPVGRTNRRPACPRISACGWRPGGCKSAAWCLHRHGPSGRMPAPHPPRSNTAACRRYDGANAG